MQVEAPADSEHELDESLPPEHDGPFSLLLLGSTGLSTTIEPRVVNLGAPNVELRLSYRFRNQPWIELDAGLALIAYPEIVPELRLGARFFPIGAFTQIPVLRDFYLRAGAHALLSGPGFDYAPNAEMGFAFSARRLIVLVAMSETYYVRNPRLATEVRLGVGFRF
jgi:hypothetical protein